MHSRYGVGAGRSNPRPLDITPTYRSARLIHSINKNNDKAKPGLKTGTANNKPLQAIQENATVVRELVAEQEK